MSSETKTCTKCQETKSLDDFYFHKKGNSYFGSCKLCQAAMIRESERKRRKAARIEASQAAVKSLDELPFNLTQNGNMALIQRGSVTVLTIPENSLQSKLLDEICIQMNKAYSVGAKRGAAKERARQIEQIKASTGPQITTSSLELQGWKFKRHVIKNKVFEAVYKKGSIQIVYTWNAFPHPGVTGIFVKGMWFYLKKDSPIVSLDTLETEIKKYINQFESAS